MQSLTWQVPVPVVTHTGLGRLPLQFLIFNSFLAVQYCNAACNLEAVSLILETIYSPSH